MRVRLHYKSKPDNYTESCVAFMIWPMPISQCVSTIETAVYRTVRTVV